MKNEPDALISSNFDGGGEAQKRRRVQRRGGLLWGDPHPEKTEKDTERGKEHACGEYWATATTGIGTGEERVP